MTDYQKNFEKSDDEMEAILEKRLRRKVQLNKDHEKKSISFEQSLLLEYLIINKYNGPMLELYRNAWDLTPLNSTIKYTLFNLKALLLIQKVFILTQNETTMNSKKTIVF